MYWALSADSRNAAHRNYRIGETLKKDRNEPFFIRMHIIPSHTHTCKLCHGQQCKHKKLKTGEKHNTQQHST